MSFIYHAVAIDAVYAVCAGHFILEQADSVVSMRIGDAEMVSCAVLMIRISITVIRITRPLGRGIVGAASADAGVDALRIVVAIRIIIVETVPDIISIRINAA